MTRKVNDFSIVVIRIGTVEFSQLDHSVQEMLRMYPVRSWAEDTMFAYEIASYRVDEINNEIVRTTPNSDTRITP